MSSTEHRRQTNVSPDAPQDEFESLRHEFHARLQRERRQLTELAAALTRCDGDPSATFESLRRLAHRMHGTAAIFECSDVANAAEALERASGAAALTHADRSEPSVWSALVALVDMLADRQRASLSTDCY
jgi:HPt (histidine-containing phosphotransfer) domain-containing protein